MAEFDRELAKSIGKRACQAESIERRLIADSYYETIKRLNLTESKHVSEIWIDYLTERLSNIIIDNKDSYKIAQEVFKIIAKT